MKRILLTILAITLCLTIFSGCSNNQYKGPLSCISHFENDGTEIALMDMTEDTHKKLVSVLNKGEWQDGVTNCGYDYEFKTKNETIRYHSECGTFIDITNGQAMVLSDEGREEINALLGASDCIEPGIEPVRYTCDLSKYPTNKDCMGYGKVAEISDEKLLIVPGSDQDKIEFGEVVWLICDEAKAYSVGQVVTYTFRDVKTPNKDGEPLNIIALLVYME